VTKAVSRRTSTTRRTWIRGTAIALVGALLAAGCARAAAEPSAAAPRLSPPTTATPSAGAAVYDWSRSPAAALDLGGGATSTLSAVLAPQTTGAPWIITGTVTASDDTTAADVWTSTDTQQWRRTTLSGLDAQALAASDWGARTVIVGSIGRGPGRRAAVWISPTPGAPFVAVPSDAGLLPTPEPGPGKLPVTGTASMDVVGAGTQGVFAAGSVSGRPAIWFSTDGQDWVRVAGADQLLDGEAGAQVATMLVTPAGVMAVGTVRDGSQTDGAIWRSGDGLSWHRYGAPDNPFAGGGDHRIDGLTTDAAGSYIAVGAVRSGPEWTPASWISPDGNAWSQASEAFPIATRAQPGPGGTVVRAVTTTSSSPQLVAVGGSGGAQRMWTSEDGINWTEVPLPTAVADSTDWSADLVASSGTTTVVVDAAPGQPDVLVRQGTTWHEVSADTGVFGPVSAAATPGGLATDDGHLVLAVDIERPGRGIGTATTSVMILTSTDGIHWTRRSAAGTLRNARFASLRTVDGSLVGVGTSTSGRDGPVATIWTSTDGRRWRVVVADGGETAAPRAATAIGVVGTTTVAVGSGPVGAGSGATPAAQVWTNGEGIWTANGTLDALPSLAAEQPLGTCSNGRTLVVVGYGTRQGVPRTDNAPPASTPVSTSTTIPVTGNASGPYGQGSDGTVAYTWATTDGTAWTPGTVSPLTGSGGHETMQGCVALGAGFLAWGGTPKGPGSGAPALWSSPDGVTWTQEPTPTLGVIGSVAPVTDLDTAGRSWTAVTGGLLAAVADPGDPDVAADDPVLPASSPVSASGPDGSASIWTSEDHGVTWSRITTVGPTWEAAGALATDLVTSLGRDLVVVGQADGRIAAWVGAPPG
jgi:hypothetical protein